MRGRGPGRRGVRLFTDFWRENLNFPALSITNRRGGGRGRRGGGEMGAVCFIILLLQARYVHVKLGSKQLSQVGGASEYFNIVTMSIIHGCPPEIGSELS